jgi:hypothetical protein
MPYVVAYGVRDVANRVLWQSGFVEEVFWIGTAFFRCGYAAADMSAPGEDDCLSAGF